MSRSTDLAGTRTSVSVWQTNTFFVDTSTSANAVYYYWVEASTSTSGAQSSDYSFVAVGYSSAAPVPGYHTLTQPIMTAQSLSLGTPVQAVR